jgi:hypothetical protein
VLQEESIQQASQHQDHGLHSLQIAEIIAENGESRESHALMRKVGK